MANSIQEQVRSILGPDPTLADLVADRIYPGQIPDDEAPTPWLFYTVPTTVPFDQLDAAPEDTRSEMEFHALADRYAEAKAIIDAVFAVVNNRIDPILRRCAYLEITEEVTDLGYHHILRVEVWWVRG